MQRPHGLGCCDGPAFPFGCDLLKLRQVDGLAALVLSLFFRNGNAFPLALQDVLPLQLRHGPKHGKHKLSGGCGGVNGLFPTDELHALCGQLFHQFQQITGIAGKATDGLHDDDITLMDIFHHLLQFRTVGIFAARALDIDFIHAEGFHQYLLTHGVLLLRTDPDISDFQNASRLSLVNLFFSWYTNVRKSVRLGVSSVKTYTLDEIREIVSKLAAQYGAKRVYLFGSYARGDMTDSSDIDLRIDKGSIKGFQLAGLLLDLEDSLGRSVDLVPTTSLDQRFLDSIRDDEVLLYEAS